MDDQFKKDFDEKLYHRLLELKALHDLLKCITDNLVRQSIDGFAAYQLYIAAVSGFVVNFDDYLENVISFLDIEIRQKYRKLLKRNHKDIKPTPSAMVVSNPPTEYELERRNFAIQEAETSKEKYRGYFDELFPSQNSKDGGCPSIEDIDALLERVRALRRPIKAHRDTVAAHPSDPNPILATWKDMEDAFTDLQQILNLFSLVARKTSLGFSLESTGWGVENACEAISNAIRRFSVKKKSA